MAENKYHFERLMPTAEVKESVSEGKILNHITPPLFMKPHFLSKLYCKSPAMVRKMHESCSHE